MKTKLLKLLRPSVVLLTGAGIILLLLISIDLSAQEAPTPSQLNSPESVETDSLSDCLPPAPKNATSVAAYAVLLLPVIPSKPSASLSLPSGVAPSFIGPFPGEAPPNPDSFRVLFGYQGPDYNTFALDGQVVVLDSSLHTWPTSTWKVTGLFRNQTRCPVHISSITARLLGSRGELLETATATLPIDNLRPGEPAPLMIEARLPVSAVKSVEWNVDSAPAPAPMRQFEFAIWNAMEAPDGSTYTLDGMITNEASTTAIGTQVVVAWLDENNRVLYVGSAKMNPYTNPVDSADLTSQASAGFLYSTKDSVITPVLGSAANLALWGISQ